MTKKLFPLILIVTLASCASIVSKSQYNVSVNSSPSDAKFSIVNGNGMTIHSGTTPALISLSSGDGYFKKAQYSLKFEKKGYDTKISTLSSSLNGWYFGNILFGGLIGLLIVDPLTGAMYKLPENATVSLDSNSHASNDLKIRLLEDLSSAQKSQLISIN